MRSISKSSAGSILRSGAVQAFTALRKFVTITVQRFLRRKKIKACGERKPLSDFTVAVEQALKWLTGAKQLKLQIRIILFRCDRHGGCRCALVTMRYRNWRERGIWEGGRQPGVMSPRVSVP